MDMNASFMLTKTFESKESQYLTEDEENEDSRGNNPEVTYPEFIFANECDLIYAFESPLEEMTKHIRHLFIKACLNRVTFNKALVDNREGVNIMPSSTLKKINKQNSKLIET